MVRLHQVTWKRPPTPAELKALIDSHVRDEILFREGVSMGLDRDDAVIRRRVQQKLAVVTEESHARATPTVAELQDYLGKHAARYARPAVVGFDQVMFDPARHGSNLRADLDAALVRLRAGAKPDEMGDSSMLPTTTDAVDADLLARDYGEGFAAAVIALPIGPWSGPIASGYGAHLVRVTRSAPGRQALLAEVRSAVERDLENDRRLLANEDYFAKALRKYDVVIDTSLAGVPKAGVRD
jgi:hypothetical protein